MEYAIKTAYAAAMEAVSVRRTPYSMASRRGLPMVIQNVIVDDVKKHKGRSVERFAVNGQTKAGGRRTGYFDELAGKLAYIHVAYLPPRGYSTWKVCS